MDLISLEEERRIIPAGGGSYPGLPVGTVLYLQSNTYDGDTNIVDSSTVGRTVDTNNGVAHDTAMSKFGTSSLLFNNATDDCVLWADSVDWYVGSDDFTVSLFFARNTLGTYQWLFAQSQLVPDAPSRSIESVILNSGAVRVDFIYGDVILNIDSTTLVNDSLWHFLKFTRVGDTIYLYLDGVLEGTANIAGLIANNSRYKFAIGCLGERTTVSNHDGWIDEFLYVNGTGDASTDVPTGPLLAY